MTEWIPPSEEQEEEFRRRVRKSMGDPNSPGSKAIRAADRLRSKLKQMKKDTKDEQSDQT